MHHEHPHEMDPGGRFALGLLCGAMIGAALGLLFAPKAGVDTRHQLSDSAQRARRKAADAYGGATEALNGAVERGRKAFDAGKQAFDDARGKRKDDVEPLPDRPAGVSVS